MFEAIKRTMMYPINKKKPYTSILSWYILCLIVTGLLFSSYALKPYMYLMGLTSVALFTLGVPNYVIKWNRSSKKRFVSRLFLLAFFIRLIHAILIYNFNQLHYGTFYESNIADIGFYHDTALELVNNKCVSLLRTLRLWGISADDSGYILYLFFLYKLTGATGTVSSVVVPLIMKSALGAVTCIYSYRIASNHFGESVGRMAGVFCALHFSMIWWCGSMMKETEMVFCSMMALFYMDKTLISSHFGWKDYLLATLAVISTFFFRTALGIILILSFCMALFLLKDYEIGRQRRRVIIAFSVLLILLFAGNKLFELSAGLFEKVIGTEQEVNMAWRSTRDGGNSFAKYAGATVFAPMIFTIPFPTMVYTQHGQEMQMQVNGGNFIKNVLSFFVILSLISLFIEKKWRHHILIIAFFSGYLIALVLSEFAQSGRFHMPIMPVFMIFAAYGMSSLNEKTYKWFNLVLPFELIICVAWSWFKLAGRSMI